MSKCVICQDEIMFVDLFCLLFKQERCNKCAKLFKYHTKNVKIRWIIIKIRCLCYSHYIKSYVSDEHIVNHYNTLIKKYGTGNNIHCLKTLLDCRIVDERRLVIFFQREQLDELRLCLQKLEITVKLRYIELIEVIK